MAGARTRDGGHFSRGSFTTRPQDPVVNELLSCGSEDNPQKKRYVIVELGEQWAKPKRVWWVCDTRLKLCKTKDIVNVRTYEICFWILTGTFLAIGYNL